MLSFLPDTAPAFSGTLLCTALHRNTPISGAITAPPRSPTLLVAAAAAAAAATPATPSTPPEVIRLSWRKCLPSGKVKVEERSRSGLSEAVAVTAVVSVSRAFRRSSSCRVGVGRDGGGVEVEVEVEVAWCSGKKNPGRSSGLSERRPCSKDRAVA